ncbi:MAG: prepilin-type N-terminal cleavage/methylation domain-containing protein [Planctomycetales bacterium]|nr:prepilin-type N-terminal cleavage/methylation domain-containing protein [Planctomycetales bacterium]
MISFYHFSTERWRPLRSAHRRCGFTLIELLIAIGIIGVMAGMLLFTLAGAMLDAKTTRTRGTIEKINSVILQRWEEYRYRSVKLDLPLDWLEPQQGLAGRPLLSHREAARLRMVALRDLMRMELPDRYTDLLYPPTRLAARLEDNTIGYVDAYTGYRSTPGNYNNLRQYFGYSPISAQYVISGDPIPSIETTLAGRTAPTVDYEQAELLYAIVATSNIAGGSALEAFRPSEIGDLDSDGYPEFLDAWGEPIRWLRWPAGFASSLNQSYAYAATPGAAPAAPDALDPMRTDYRWRTTGTKPWLVVPLIISAGPDQSFDIVFNPLDTNTNLPVFNYAHTTWTSPPAPNANFYNVDPFYEIPANKIGNASPVMVGSTFDSDGDGSVSGWDDNLTNHTILTE